MPQVIPYVAPTFDASRIDLPHLQDFGVWNISYESVSCASHWSGFKDAAALGSVPSLADGACCPADPTVNRNVTRVSCCLLTRLQGSTNDTCPSFSDKNGEPCVNRPVLSHPNILTLEPSPDTASSGAVTQQLRVPFVLVWVVTQLILLLYSSPL